MADEKRQTLDIPEGTTFEFRDGKLIFGHESDIVIRTNMGGYKFQKIFSKRGSVQVIPPAGVEFDVDEIEAAAGDIFFNGRVRARNVKAKTIHFQDGALAGDRFEATEEVVLAGGRIDILHVKAPRVVIDQDAVGTVLVCESQNDPGRGRTKGGFRSLDDARAALERLLGSAPAPVAAAAARAVPVPPAVPAGDVGEQTILASPARRAEVSSTEEIRSATPDTQPALPKSSVFRKRT